MKPIELFRSALESAGKRVEGPNRHGWYRSEHPCASGKDDKKSLAFTESPDGTVVVKSFKLSHDVFSICQAIGLEVKELFPVDERKLEWKRKEGTKPLREAYEYLDATGAPKYRVGRTDDKDFPQWHYQNSRLVPGLDNSMRELFMLPHLLEAIKAGRTIYVVEGEKDALEGWRHGIACTTKSGGAGASWEERFTETLEDCDVVVVCDKDESGEKCTKEIASALKGRVSSLKIVEAKTGKDLADHLAAGLSVDDLVERPDLQPKNGLSVAYINPEGFAPVQVDYLWEPYFPRGKSILLDADGGTGKTTFLLTVAACLGNGHIPFSAEQVPKIKTLYLGHGEDSDDELATIFLANGGDLSRIAFHQNPGLLFTPDGLRLVRDTILEEKVDMVICDCLLYFIAPLVKSTNDAQAVVPIVSAINRIALNTGVCWVDVRHTRKGKPDDEASAMGLGSVAFRNSHRGQLVMRWHPEMKGVVVVTDEKGSILVERGEPLAFRRVDNSIQMVQIDDNPFEKMAKMGGRPPIKRTNAKDDLSKVFGKDTEATKDYIMAELPQYSESTLLRALKDMGGWTTGGNRGGQSWWHVPPTQERLL